MTAFQCSTLHFSGKGPAQQRGGQGVNGFQFGFGGLTRAFDGGQLLVKNRRNALLFGEGRERKIKRKKFV